MCTAITPLTDANPSYEITGDLSSIASFSDTIVKEISNANGKFVSISVPLAAEHCYITQLITVNTFYGQLASIIFVIVACAVITGIILHTIFNHMINHPVQELQVRMKHISEGNFERDSSIEWQHELGDIGRSINDLAEDVKTLMDQGSAMRMRSVSTSTKCCRARSIRIFCSTP